MLILTHWYDQLLIQIWCYVTYMLSKPVNYLINRVYSNAAFLIAVHYQLLYLVFDWYDNSYKWVTCKLVKFLADKGNLLWVGYAVHPIKGQVTFKIFWCFTWIKIPHAHEEVKHCLPQVGADRFWVCLCLSLKPTNVKSETKTWLKLRIMSKEHNIGFWECLVQIWPFFWAQKNPSLCYGHIFFDIMSNLQSKVSSRELFTIFLLVKASNTTWCSVTMPTITDRKRAQISTLDPQPDKTLNLLSIPTPQYKIIHIHFCLFEQRLWIREWCPPTWIRLGQ